MSPQCRSPRFGSPGVARRGFYHRATIREKRLGLIFWARAEFTFLMTSMPESCLPPMVSPETAARCTALPRLATDPQAIAAVEELIRETRARLGQLDPLHDRNGEY